MLLVKLLPLSVSIDLGAPNVQIKNSRKASATLMTVEDFKGLARENSLNGLR